LVLQGLANFISSRASRLSFSLYCPEQVWLACQ
jgi:hypothetical protein